MFRNCAPDTGRLLSGVVTIHLVSPGLRYPQGSSGIDSFCYFKPQLKFYGSNLVHIATSISRNQPAYIATITIKQYSRVTVSRHRILIMVTGPND
jgi:hypothetical protein